MQYSTIYNPLPKRPFYHKNNKPKKNLSGNIFRLPRSILSYQALSPKNQTGTLSIQKIQQQLCNTKFTKQYRQNLRKTIFSQTKGMKPNKFERLDNQKVFSMKQLQKSSSKKISPYASKKASELPSTINILYRTITNQQKSHKRRIQPLQLAVQKLPIIQLQKIRKKRFRGYAEENNDPQQIYQNGIANGSIGIRKQRVASHFEKNSIQPWDTTQEFNLQVDQS